MHRPFPRLRCTPEALSIANLRPIIAADPRLLSEASSRIALLYVICSNGRVDSGLEGNMTSVPKPNAGPLGPGDPGTQVPEWELPPVEEKRKSRLSVLEIPTAQISLPTTSQRWKSKMAEMRRRGCSKLSRRSWIIIACIAAIIIIALAIGLGVGLTRGKKGQYVCFEILLLVFGTDLNPGLRIFRCLGMPKCTPAI